jgi:4'-phosphopantetheinyl transferase EntD
VSAGTSGLAAALTGLGERARVSVAAVPIVAAHAGTRARTGAGRSRAADRAAGLAAAAESLRVAGCTHAAVLGHAADGRPLWPPGFTGSIAHADGVAVAAAVAIGATAPAGVGVDVEHAGALPAADATAVLDADERRVVSRHGAPDDVATLLWSAKEAAFKAWSTATEGGLGDVDPVDIHVELDEARGAVRVVANGSLAARVRDWGAATGEFAVVAGYVVTLVTLAATRATAAAAADPRSSRSPVS